jgi:hypothetical protein
LAAALGKGTFALAMVAEANNRRSAAIYQVRSFRSQDALVALVALARKALADEFGRELAPLGLNTAQAHVIVMLADEAVGTAAGLCRELSHDAGAMTRASSSRNRRAL